jgi:hypothetical protein
MIDMADTGDGTWGHLADTEHFGRVSRDYIVVPKADFDLPKYRGSTRAGHCMIYSRSEEKIFGIYTARAMILVSGDPCALFSTFLSRRFPECSCSQKEDFTYTSYSTE